MNLSNLFNSHLTLLFLSTKNIKHRDKQPYRLAFTLVGELEEPDKYGFDMWEEVVMGKAAV